MSLESPHAEEILPEELAKVLVGLGCTPKGELNTEFVSPKVMDFSDLFQKIEYALRSRELKGDFVRGTGTNNDKIFVGEITIVKHPDAPDSEDKKGALNYVVKKLQNSNCHESESDGGSRLYMITKSDVHALFLCLSEQTSLEAIEHSAITDKHREGVTYELGLHGGKYAMIVRFHGKILLTVLNNDGNNSHQNKLRGHPLSERQNPFDISDIQARLDNILANVGANPQRN